MHEDDCSHLPSSSMINVQSAASIRVSAMGMSEDDDSVLLGGELRSGDETLPLIMDCMD